MKTVCIYHSVDLDGWMSAAIVKHWHESIMKSQENITGQSQRQYHEINFIGYNYGQPIPDLSEYDKVIMCDISFKDKNNTAQPMINLYEEFKALGKEVYYIDHHISAFNDIKLVSEDGDIPFLGLQDIHYSACELTWKYFFPNNPMPEIVRLLGRYDCFGHKGTDEERKVLEFQYGARQCISNYEEAYDYLIKKVGVYTLSTIHDKGKAIYQYLCTDAKQAYKNGFEIKFNQHDKSTVKEIMKAEGKSEDDIEWYDSKQLKYKFICINKERFNPINFGIDYHLDGYDGCACFHFDGTHWCFSLYNDNGLVDCSIIAKQFGGGGHRGASGFRCDNETFLNIISTK